MVFRRKIPFRLLLASIPLETSPFLPHRHLHAVCNRNSMAIAIKPKQIVRNSFLPHGVKKIREVLYKLSGSQVGGVEHLMGRVV